MSDRVDPLEDVDRPALDEQIEPYRDYGDTELALSLLGFQKHYGGGVPALCSDGEDIGTFDVRCQPADAGADYVCPTCEEPVRGITIPGVGVLRCPLCGNQPGALAIGRGLEDVAGETA